MMTHLWQCPFCNTYQAVTDGRSVQIVTELKVGETDLGYRCGSRQTAIACSNSKCMKIDVLLEIGSFDDTYGPRLLKITRKVYADRAYVAKSQPDYIPKVLRNDYEEACSIRDLSPKAAATLARRCLQGMLRDFCGISRNRLIDEIKELERQVAAGTAPVGVMPDSLGAIDAVRNVGNIGAHMEKDIDIIIDVEPAEAQLLIGLVETLFVEWYTSRHDRAVRLAAIKKLADDKKLAKVTPPVLPASSAVLSVAPPAPKQGA